MKVIKNKGAFVQYEDLSWGIDTRIKVGDEYRHFKKKGYPTLSAAKSDYERAKAEFISSKSLNKYEVLIFDDLLIEYSKMRKIVVNKSTMGCDQSVFNVYFLPYFGKKLLKDCFNTEAMNEWYHSIVDTPKYTNNKKAKVITRMKDLLKFAYMHKYIDPVIYQDCDVCLYQVKYSKKPEHEKVIWTDEEERAFWDVLQDYPRDNLMFKVFFACGARIGEFMGLQPKCFDYKKRKINICQQAIYIPNEGLVLTDKLKTHDSYRSVIISQQLADEIEDFIQVMSLKDDEYIFFETDKSMPIARTTFRRRLYKYCELAGIPKIVPHTSRHMQATKLAKVCHNGEEIEAAARRLGHSPEMFMNTYARHASDEKEEELLRRLDA